MTRSVQHSIGVISMAYRTEGRYVYFYNNAHEIFVLDADKKMGGLYLWVFDRKYSEDLVDNRLRIIGVDEV